MKFFRTLILTSLACLSFLVQAEEEEIPAKSLVELLELVKEGKVVNSKVNSNREKQFLADRARQAGEVRKAERWQAEEEAEASRLEKIFERNEEKIAAQEEILSKRLGSLRELFGVLQQVSGDTQGVFEGSIVSSQLPGRGGMAWRICAVHGQEH